MKNAYLPNQRGKLYKLHCIGSIFSLELNVQYIFNVWSEGKRNFFLNYFSLWPCSI